jgi:hypothetical protein
MGPGLFHTLWHRLCGLPHSAAHRQRLRGELQPVNSGFDGLPARVRKAQVPGPISSGNQEASFFCNKTGYNLRSSPSM